MQHLGQIGLHAAAFPGSQDNDGKLTIGHCQARTSQRESRWITVTEVVERIGCRPKPRGIWHRPNFLIKSTIVAGYYSQFSEETTSARGGARLAAAETAKGGTAKGPPEA
jgi:hypothetical protein